MLSAVNPATVRFFSFGTGDAVAANGGHFSDSNSPGYEGIVNVATAGVPEPTNWVILLAGFGLVGFAARRRRAVADA